MNKRLLEHLRQHGFLDEQQLRSLLARQQQFGGDVIDIMLRLKMLSERDCARGLASFYRYPLVDLNQTTPEEEALALLDGEYAHSHGVLPLQVDHDARMLDVAVFDPARTLEALEFIRRRAGLEPRPHITPPTALVQAIAYFYFGDLPEPSSGAPEVAGSNSGVRSLRPATPASGVEQAAVVRRGGGFKSTSGAAAPGAPAGVPRAALRSNRRPGSSNPGRRFDWAGDSDPNFGEDSVGLGGHAEPLELSGGMPKIGATVDPVAVEMQPLVPDASREALEAANKRIERLEELLDHERRLVQVLVDVLGETGIISRDELTRRLRVDG